MAYLSVRVCKKTPAVDSDDEIVIHYICKEGKVFELPRWRMFEHPETGRQTLVPAIYDRRRNMVARAAACGNETNGTTSNSPT